MMKMFNVKFFFISVITCCLLSTSIVMADSTSVSDTAIGTGFEKVYERWEWIDTELSSIMAHISSVAGVDIVLDPKISKKFSVSLRNKSWVQALNIICTMNNLQILKMEGYLFVMDRAEYIARQVAEEQNKRNLESVEELVTKVIDLKNTVASDMIEPVNGLLSARGSASVVNHTNSIIIHELEKNIPKVEAFVDKLDRELKQISIEVKIVEVGSRIQNDLGIQWSVFDRSNGAQASHLADAFSTDNTAESFGTGVIAGALEKATFGILDDKGFKIALEYLFTEASSEIVAEPHITTLENNEAKITMGSKVPVNTQDEAGNTKVTLIDAGTELVVMPTLTGGGQIKMDLKPTKKSYEITDQGPIINEQSAETNVVVKDGETIVIAGLTSDENIKSEGGIPFLKDIPILGFFFKKATKASDKKDLVIFVTPRLIKSSVLDAESAKSSDSVHVNTGDFVVE